MMHVYDRPARRAPLRQQARDIGIRLHIVPRSVHGVIIRVNGLLYIDDDQRGLGE